MNRWIREAGRGLCALLFVITLVVQSVLPVYADTADTANEAETYSLDYFDRIAVNSVRGILTIRYGEEFSISFPAGWEELPGFSVQDDILVVSGRKAVSASAEKSSGGSAVVLGEDEPAEEGTRQIPESGKAEAPSDTPAENSGTDETAEENAVADATAAENSSTEEAAEAEESAEEAETAETEEVAETAEDGDVSETPDAVPEMVITIPAGIGLDTLRIAMESGDLILTDITANAVTIQSGGGNLILKDVSLGTVDIYTEDGMVSMEESTFGSLNIGMGEGEVSVSADDGLSGCRVELKTGDGEITYNGQAEGTQFLQPGNGKRFLTVQIGRGDIRIDG